jgi:hypothetical protein
MFLARRQKTISGYGRGDISPESAAFDLLSGFRAPAAESLNFRMNQPAQLIM